MRSLVGQALLFALSLGVLPAAVPDWIGQASVSPPQALAQDHALVVLLQEKTVRFITQDQVRTCVRGVVQVMRGEGRELARASYSFNADTTRVLERRGWILDPQGKVIRTLGKSDVLELSASSDNRFWTSYRVIRASANLEIPVGGRFAWEFIAEGPAGILDQTDNFQSAYPVVLHRFTVEPAPAGVLVWNAYADRLASPVEGPVKGSLVWEQKSQSPLPSQRPESFLGTPLVVSVRCMPAARPTPPSWQETSRFLFAEIAAKLARDPQVDARARAIVENRGTRWDRIRALGEFVQKQVSYLSITADNDYLAGYRPHSPAEVIASRYGDCKDKATLLVALLDSIGEKAWVVLLNAGNPVIVRDGWAGLQFNHAIVGIEASPDTPASWPRLEIPGLPALVLFDPTSTETPLGALPAPDQQGNALVLCNEGAPIVRIPASPPGLAAQTLTNILTLHEDASMQVEAVLEVDGAPAASLVQIYNRQGQRSVLSGFEREWSGSGYALRLNGGALDWDSEKARATLRFSIRAERCLRKASDLLLFQPFLTSTSAGRTPWKDPALRGWSVRQSQQLTERNRWKLPPGTVLEEMPGDSEQRTDLSVFSVHYRTEGAQIVCEATLQRRGGLLDRAGYEAEREFFRKATELLRRPIVLKKAP